MSFVRNRDVKPATPRKFTWTFVLVAGVIGGIFHKDFATPLRGVFISSTLGGLALLIYWAWLWRPARMQVANEFVIEKHRQDQNRLTAAECREAGLVIGKYGLPLASLQENPKKRAKEMIGLRNDKLEGHALVVGATRSGKGMHLTQTLLTADCAAVVIDPKGEQYARTAGYRAEHVGPVYNLPTNTLNLMDYYDLLSNTDLTELHFHLMKPWADKQSIFADKVKFVFAAAAAYAKAHKLNPLKVVLDAAQSAPGDALGALMEADYESVMNFTNGDDPGEMDKFAASSWGSLGVRMFDYQQSWQTITTGGMLGSIPLDWAEQKGTIYITYPFDQLKGVGGVVSAIVAALMRYQKMHDRRDQMIVAVDELPTVGLNNIDEYLSTVGGYKITMLLYIQSFAQLVEIYGPQKAETILSNCQHQVWHPPADSPTAKRMSEIYGTKKTLSEAFSRSDKDKKMELEFGIKETSRSISMGIRPALSPEEMSGLSPEEVIVRLDRRYVTKAYRLWPVPELTKLPAPAYEFEPRLMVRPEPHWGKRLPEADIPAGRTWEGG